MAKEAIIQKYVDAISENFKMKISIKRESTGWVVLCGKKSISEPMAKGELEKAVKMIFNMLKLKNTKKGRETKPVVSDEEAIDSFRSKRGKEYSKRPGAKEKAAAYKKAYINIPENRDRKNAIKRENYADPEKGKVYRDKQREYISQPEVRARRAKQARERRAAIRALQHN